MDWTNNKNINWSSQQLSLLGLIVYRRPYYRTILQDPVPSGTIWLSLFDTNSILLCNQLLLLKSVYPSILFGWLENKMSSLQTTHKGDLYLCDFPDVCQKQLTNLRFMYIFAIWIPWNKLQFNCLTRSRRRQTGSRQRTRCLERWFDKIWWPDRRTLRAKVNVSVSDAGVGEHHGHRLIAGNRLINSHYPLIIVQAL